MLIRDKVQELFSDNDFLDWYPEDGRPGIPPARLALVSILQYAENLTDRQAARAVACRIDWKYCLGMELTEPGFDHSVLSEFRDRLAEGDRANRLLALMVDRLAAAGLVKQRGRQRTDSTHVLAAVRKLSRVELVGETMRTTLEAIAAVDEQWLARLVTPQWVYRYGEPVRGDHLSRRGTDTAEYVLQVGADGMRLLHAVYHDSTPPWISRLARVDVLRQVWVQQYFHDHNGQLCWREAHTTRARKSRDGTRRTPHGGGGDDTQAARLPWSSRQIVTPHDPQARFSHKLGKAEWIGYKDHQTETCDEKYPNLIVQVLTTPATEQDFDALPLIHHHLAAQGTTPSEHLVDAGYVTPQAVHDAATQHEITLVGPIRPDPRSSQRPGFAKADFHIDWDTHTVTCPQGVTSLPWKPTVTDRQATISVQFRRADCRVCAVRSQCTTNVTDNGRHLLLLPQPLHEIQTNARAEQQTPQWKERYALRVGCEATVSETVRAHGLRHCRYRGLTKTHVQHVLTAAGTNLIRLSQYPPADTNRRRMSPFQRLCHNLTKPRSP